MYLLCCPCTGPSKCEKLPINFLIAQGYKCQPSNILEKLTCLDTMMKIIIQHSQPWETSRRSNLTWVSIYAIRVVASVPHTDFSSSIGTAYCPIRPWTHWQQAFVLSNKKIISEEKGKEQYKTFWNEKESSTCVYNYYMLLYV